MPPEAHKKILEKFPDSLPRNPGNVIPPAADNKAEEVGCCCFFVCFGELTFLCCSAEVFLNAPRPVALQKVNDSGTDDGSPPPIRETSIQEPGAAGRAARPEAPVDSMLKDLATIIFSTFLLAGWVAFMITYPKVGLTVLQ